MTILGCSRNAYTPQKTNKERRARLDREATSMRKKNELVKKLDKITKEKNELVKIKEWKPIWETISAKCHIDILPNIESFSKLEISPQNCLKMEPKEEYLKCLKQEAELHDEQLSKKDIQKRKEKLEKTLELLTNKNQAVSFDDDNLLNDDYDLSKESADFLAHMKVMIFQQDSLTKNIQKSIKYYTECGYFDPSFQTMIDLCLPKKE